MKRNKFLILPVLVLFLAAVSCGKETAVGGGNLDNNPEEASGEGGGAVDPSEPVAPGTFRAISEGPEYDAAKEQTRAYTKWPGSGFSKFDVYWKNEDLVKIYYDRTGESSGVYKASVTGQTKIAPLSIEDGDVDNESGSYWAVSPSSAAVSFSGSTFTLRLPSEQTCKDNGAENCDQSALLMVAKCGPERELNFKQTVSFIRLGFNTELLTGFYCTKVEIESATNDLTGDFTVSYSGSKPVPSAISANGSKKLTLIIRGTNFVNGNYVYAFLPTGTYPSGDLTFTFTITNGSATYYVTKTSADEVVFARAKYYMIGFEMPSFTDLSESETANCYVVKTPGYYCFDAATRGNGVVTTGATAAGVGATITGGASAAVYHSDGTDFIDSGFTDGGFIYANGKIYFKTKESLSTAGNKLVSVKDASGTTLWSWHIWCNKNLADKAIKDKVGNESVYTLMNMNLGAHQESTFSATGGNGYYYQWGRKDPMDQRYSSDGKLKSPFAYDSTTTPSLSNSIQNPSTMYAKENSPVSTTTYYDWWCLGMNSSSAAVSNTSIQNENLMTAATDACSFSKTMFDPCPPGYHVPTMRQLMAFRSQGYSASSGILTLTDSQSHTHYFPQSSIRNQAGGGILTGYYGESTAYYYTCYPSQGSGKCVRVWMSATNFGMNTNNQQWYACIIRCAKN